MDRYNDYRPGPDYDSRESRSHYNRSDRDRPPPPPRDDRPPPPPNDGDMFHFRGAANRPRDNHDNYDRYHSGDSYHSGPPAYGGDSYRLRDDARRDNGRAFDFNFQSGNGPSFAPTTDYPSARRGPRSQQSARPRDRGQSGRGGRGGRGRGRGGFVPRRAGDRALLRTEREPTPDQLEGMNDGQSRFNVLDGLDESESEEMDLGTPSDDEAAENKAVAHPPVTMDNSDSEDDHPRAKRARVHSPEPTQEDAKPKWSNPDPYWALPPPDESQTKKKDVVKLIRKAKVDAAKSEAKSADSSDFISLNFEDGEGKNSGSESGELSPAPESEGANATAAPPAAPQKGINMALPAGRLDVWPPPPPENDALDMATRKQETAISTAKARQKAADKGKKRKRPARDFGDIVEEWSAPEDADPTPWLNLDAPGCPRLHEEILDFYDYVRPRDFEEQVRLNLVKRIQQAIQPRFSQVQIKAFGSFASGLYLPTADMDLVAVSSDFLSRGYARIATNNQMRKFADCLVAARIVKPGLLTVITGARVPIIKLVDNETGLRVDVSFENNSGLTAQKTFEDWKQRYPSMPIIVSLIKQFLVMRGMSEVFSGGLGGYSVICLVVSIVRRLLKSKGAGWDQMQHLDHILMEFLIHYGEEFDRYNTGIQMEPWGYISKTHWSPHGAKRPQPERLLIIDPNKYNNDISGGSKNVDIIFDAFRNAYDQINDSLDDVEASFDRDGERNSILERVWGGNYGLFEIQRARLRTLWDGQTRPAGFPRGKAPPPSAPAAASNRTEALKPSKKQQKLANGGVGTKESPIDLDVGKDSPDTLPTFQSINKPKAQSGAKARGPASNQPSSQAAGVKNNSNASKAKPPKKEKKPKKKDENGKSRKELKTEKASEASRSLAFKKAHPGVACPERLSRADFKNLTKKHGPGIAST